MARYRTWITTPLERAKAFALVSRFDHAAEWDPGVESGSMLTPEPVASGSRFELRARFLGRTLPLEYEITEFEPPTRLVMRAENTFVRSIDTITFEATGDSTEITYTEITYDALLEPKGAVRLAEPLLALAFRRIGDRAAAGLRRYVGSPDHASP